MGHVVVRVFDGHLLELGNSLVKAVHGMWLEG
jgi:hypothetical protein